MSSERTPLLSTAHMAATSLSDGNTGAPRADEHARRYGSTGHIHFHSAAEKPRPRSLKDLVAKPVIRQWIADGKLYREETSREMPRIELFFDLLYVGVIHQLGKHEERQTDSQPRSPRRSPTGRVLVSSSSLSGRHGVSGKKRAGTRTSRAVMM